MRKKIILDCDGVLAAFTSGALNVVEEVTGRRYDVTDITSFDFCKSLGLSARDSRDVEVIIGSRRGFCTSLVPYPGARQGVRRLRELGDVSCVTTPWEGNPWWQAERESWLALHFGIDVVHHAVDKSVYEADVFVDDWSVHVQAWSRAWPGRLAVFWRTQHNSDEAVPWGAHSIGSWEALYQVVCQAAHEQPPSMEASP